MWPGWMRRVRCLLAENGDPIDSERRLQSSIRVGLEMLSDILNVVANTGFGAPKLNMAYTRVKTIWATAPRKTMRTGLAKVKLVIVSDFKYLVRHSPALSAGTV